MIFIEEKEFRLKFEQFLNGQTLRLTKFFDKDDPFFCAVKKNENTLGYAENR